MTYLPEVKEQKVQFTVYDFGYANTNLHPVTTFKCQQR